VNITRLFDIPCLKICERKFRVKLEGMKIDTTNHSGTCFRNPKERDMDITCMRICHKKHYLPLLSTVFQPKTIIVVPIEFNSHVEQLPKMSESFSIAVRD